MQTSKTRMTKFSIPSERVRGEHVLLLGRLLHHLGAPFPEFFQEIRAEDATPLVGVLVTGIPMNLAYSLECVEEWRSSDDYIPLQEVARSAIHALRAHFSDQLRGSQFGGIPAIAPGSFGIQFGPSSTSSYPYPPLSPTTLAVQQEITGTMLLASTMLHSNTMGALARAEKSSNFWRRLYIAALATLRETRHTPTPDGPSHHPTHPTTDPRASSPRASAPDPPHYPAAPPPSAFDPYKADDFIPVPPGDPIPTPYYDHYPTIPTSSYLYPHIPTPPPQGDLGDISAPTPDCPLPHRQRPELRGPRITVHLDPSRDTSTSEKIYHTKFGDPSGSHAARGGASASHGLEGEEESDPEELVPANP